MHFSLLISGNYKKLRKFLISEEFACPFAKSFIINEKKFARMRMVGELCKLGNFRVFFFFVIKIAAKKHENIFPYQHWKICSARP
jgi:hypothetical protein